MQRWLVELRLPVHRVRHTPRSPVFAYTTELDEWLRQQAGGLNEAHIKQHEIDGEPKQQIRANLKRMQRLRQELRETSQTHKKLISELRQQQEDLAERLRQGRARSVGSVPAE